MSAKCLTMKAVWLSLGFEKWSHFLHLAYSFSTQDLSDPLGTRHSSSRRSRMPSLDSIRSMQGWLS